MTAPLDCPCAGEHLVSAWTYDAPPDGETSFQPDGAAYSREVLRCSACHHYVSRAEMDLSGLYSGAYVEATYGERMKATFDRILALPPERSDNAGRVARVNAFAQEHGIAGRRILDVGSGLCVFLHGMVRLGWAGTALDPDPGAVEHARSTVGVATVCADFMETDGLGRFDVVAFNKVLEHVEDPVAMLARARDLLEDGGFVYLELPDGEAAAAEGPGREEFFIEHLHAFSPASTALMVNRAGFSAARIESIREPSTKYTVCAFVVAA